MTYEYRQYYPSTIIRGLDILNNSEKQVLSCGPGNKTHFTGSQRWCLFLSWNISHLKEDIIVENLFENNLKKWDYERYIKVAHRCNECEIGSFAGYLPTNYSKRATRDVL